MPNEQTQRDQALDMLAEVFLTGEDGLTKDRWGATKLNDNNYEIAAKHLKNGKSFYWDLNLPCHTRYETLFVPQHSCEGDKWNGCGTDNRFTMVAIERRGCYAFDLKTEKCAGYINEKLNIGKQESEDLVKVFEGIGKFL